MPDYLDDVQSFLNGGYHGPSPSTNRNNALVEGLRQKYKLGPDDGSLSQSDLESLDTFMNGTGPGATARARREDTANTIAKAQAQEDPDVKREADSAQAFALQKEAVKPTIEGQSQLAVTKQQGQNTLEQGRQKEAFTSSILGGQGAPSGLHGMRPAINAAGDVSFGAAPAPSAQERGMETAAHITNSLGQNALGLLEKLYPGIGQDMSKYSSIADTVAPTVGGWFYSHGGASPLSSNPGDLSDLNQMIGYIKAGATKALTNGRLTSQALKLIQEHLPDMGYSPGENYRRIRTLMTVIDPAILSGVSATESGAPLAMPGQ